MDHHASGLIDHRQAGILVEDIEGNLLRQRSNRRLSQRKHLYHLSRPQQIPGLSLPSVDSHSSCLDQNLDVRAGAERGESSKKAVKPLASIRW
jgi:hypothetical protein